MADVAGITVYCSVHRRWIDVFGRDTPNGEWDSLRMTNAGPDDPEDRAYYAALADEGRGMPEVTATRRHFLDRGGVLESRHRGGVRDTATGWEIECGPCRRDPLRVHTARFEVVLEGLVAQGIQEISLDTLARLYRRASGI
jgi:hypothetical protein